MPNNNTVAQAVTTDGKYFCPSDKAMASSTDEVQFAKNAVPLAVYLPGSSKLSNIPFKLKAWGHCTGGTTVNFTVAIYYGVNATIGNNFAIATTGAIACDSVSGNFLLQVNAVWDSVSGKIQGTYEGHLNGTAVAKTVLTNIVKPALTPATEGLGFTCTADASGSHANNAVYLDGFEIEAA